MRYQTGPFLVAGLLHHVHYACAQTIVVGGETVGKTPFFSLRVTHVANVHQLPQ
jgi:hypothetical protein